MKTKLLTVNLDGLLELSGIEKVLKDKLILDGSASNHTTFELQKDQFLSTESNYDNYLKTDEYFVHTETIIKKGKIKR